MLKDKIQDVLFFIGCVFQIVSFVPGFRNIIGNPVYSLVILLLGYIIVLYWCLLRIYKIKKPRKMKKQSKKVSFTLVQYFQRPKGLIFIMIVTTVLTISVGFTIVRNSRNPIAKSANLKAEEMQNRITEFDFIQINKVNWIGGGALALALDSDRNFPLAYIISKDQLKKMSTLTGTACALEFEAEARSDIDRATIDNIEVLVSNYRPLPKYKSMIPAPFDEVNFIYVEIDNPSIGKTNEFIAKKKVIKGEVSEIGILYLEPKKPETFVIRVNARIPGIYTIECQLTVRYKKQIQKIPLNKPEEWLFDN